MLPFVTLGIPRIDWLGDPDIALYSVIFVDIWKGIGIAMVIFHGRHSIDP